MSISYLIEEMKRSGHLTDHRLIKAFSVIDRADFVLPEDKPSAYIDEPLPIGYGQTISQPSTVALMLSLLEVKMGDKILDVGAGSGWQSTLLAFLVSRNEFGQEVPMIDQGKVFALELISNLVARAAENAGRYGFSKKVLEFHCLNASSGFLKEAPYDGIISAASGPVIPESWKEQLKVGGRIVTPVNNDLVCLKKISINDFKITKFEGFLFVPFVQN